MDQKSSQIMGSRRKIIQSSQAEIIAGTGLFLFLGIDLIIAELPYKYHEHILGLKTLIFVLNFMIPVTGACVGWVKRFPRWSYPYVGVSLLSALFMMNAATPGRTFFGYDVFGRELWGWRAWVPLGLAIVVALILSRSFEPLMKFFTNGWHDWTLFTFAMLGWIPLLIAIGFDEVDNSYTTYFTISLTVVTVLAAYLYMRATTVRHQVLALAVGIVIPVIVGITGGTLYWLAHGWVSVPGSILWSIVIILVMFSPALIGILRTATRSAPVERET
jgi:hypothetical protein